MAEPPAQSDTNGQPNGGERQHTREGRRIIPFTCESSLTSVQGFTDEYRNENKGEDSDVDMEDTDGDLGES